MKKGKSHQVINNINIRESEKFNENERIGKIFLGVSLAHYLDAMCLLMNSYDSSTSFSFSYFSCIFSAVSFLSRTDFFEEKANEIKTRLEELGILRSAVEKKDKVF